MMSPTASHLKAAAWLAQHASSSAHHFMKLTAAIALIAGTLRGIAAEKRL